MSENTSRTNSSEKHTAGALDIRNIIGGLLAVYGLILVLMGIFDDYDPKKTGDVNANLWAGLAMAVVGVGFMLWARLRPIVVPDEVPASDDGPPPAPPGH
jgi:hypothetical membrane protein